MVILELQMIRNSPGPKWIYGPQTNITQENLTDNQSE